MHRSKLVGLAVSYCAADIKQSIDFTTFLVFSYFSILKPTKLKTKASNSLDQHTTEKIKKKMELPNRKVDDVMCCCYGSSKPTHEHRCCCFANSLVGARTSTLGSRPDRLIVLCPFSVRPLIIGIPNASVLPVPVLARAMISLPSIAGSNAAL